MAEPVTSLTHLVKMSKAMLAQAERRPTGAEPNGPKCIKERVNALGKRAMGDFNFLVWIGLGVVFGIVPVYALVISLPTLSRNRQTAAFAPPPDAAKVVIFPNRTGQSIWR